MPPELFAIMSICIMALTFLLLFYLTDPFPGMKQEIVSLKHDNKALGQENEALKHMNEALEQGNEALRAENQTAMSEQIKLLTEKLNLKTTNNALAAEKKVILADMRRQIASKDDEGYDMQMHIENKARELHEMTIGWDMSKAALNAMQNELDDKAGKLEEHVAALHDKELQLESWRTNTAGTVHALQTQIDDIDQKNWDLCRELETQNDAIKTMKFEHDTSMSSLLGVLESRQRDIDAVRDDNTELRHDNDVLEQGLMGLVEECEELHDWQAALIERTRVGQVYEMEGLNLLSETGNGAEAGWASEGEMEDLMMGYIELPEDGEV
ncbi:uncharacterized protein K460DRAFT_432086 [Cucurbitaria berberidis CBS 394.84]|uniref:Uncharacterized protein n=1 Tax=Cucurbitaria berberidis CBS 394.84 TaxID=1168544 RepID=A0A9P4GBC7_9PLEO|nr:uncharacterized protein K460DRAFT_432086 [Cucurbitaria berberidis CBS 394.84]KAF1842698.1 hypothetical protein K460DRAFT_432086 [Cucurbitaria berberidis CBS 394.84]